jgi:Tol biopolymer transport system component/DNA-binding winged helix-turn-helix (wHTH) protein
MSDPGPSRRILRFGLFEMDLEQRELRRNGLKVKLQDQPFQLLAALLERPGKLITREELRKHLWPADTFVDFDHSLNAAIRRLRDALGDDPETPCFIETVPRHGYRFLADVRGSGSITEIQGGSQAPAVSHFRLLRPAILVALAVVAVLGLGAAEYLRRGRVLSPPMRTVPLTTYPGAESHPVFSKDGEQVAFIWDGDTRKGTDIYVKRIGTEKPLQLTQSRGFVCCAAWTSDDRYLAFERCTGENAGIFVVPSLGGAERRLRKTAGCNGLSWSPTGPLLVFSEKNSPEAPFALFLMSADDLQPHQLTFPTDRVVGDQDPFFSPDGKSVAFIRIIGEATADIYTVPVSGGVPRKLTFDSSFVNGATWTADSSGIVFSSHRGGGQSLWLVPAAGGEPTRLPLGGAVAAQPAISRDGHRLAYRQGLIRPNLWVIEISPDVHSSRIAKPFFLSATYNNAPQFSPDGKKVAFASQRSGEMEIWTCDAADCSDPQQLTFLKSVSGTPRWSPDGKQIVFDSRPHEHSQILMINAEGGKPVALTDGTVEDKVPSWSGDGRFVYFASNRSGAPQIWKVAAGGGRPSQVTQHGGFAAFESSDGRFLYFVKDDRAGIWRMPAGGGDEALILPQPLPENWGDWALTDRGIYYMDESGQHPAIEFAAFPDHKVTRIAQVDSLPPHGDPGFAVSPDGKRILFSQVDTSAVDIMLVENFHLEPQ